MPLHRFRVLTLIIVVGGKWVVVVGLLDRIE